MLQVPPHQGRTVGEHLRFPKAAARGRYFMPKMGTGGLFGRRMLAALESLL